MASILKVEKRRFTAFKEEYEGKETALLVDRYKFMDLYPCSASELKALGYKVRRTFPVYEPGERMQQQYSIVT